MNTVQKYINHLSMMVKKALEGKMGPFNFLIILGFFSSLVLLYISLHVHLDGISTRIDEGARQRQILEDEKGRSWEARAEAKRYRNRCPVETSDVEAPASFVGTRPREASRRS